MSSFTAKVKKKLKNGTWYPFYNTFYEKIPVDKKEILIISRSGLSLESNILAILKELLHGISGIPQNTGSTEG